MPPVGSCCTLSVAAGSLNVLAAGTFNVVNKLSWAAMLCARGAGYQHPTGIFRTVMVSKAFVLPLDPSRKGSAP